MSVDDLVERYRNALDAWDRRDVVWVFDQASAEFEFHTAQLFPGVEPVYRGREGMVRFWTSFIEEPWALFRLEVDSVEPVGTDRVLALLTFHGIEREGGEEVVRPYAHLATFRDGLIVRVDAFSGWDDARDAATAAAAGE